MTKFSPKRFTLTLVIVLMLTSILASTVFAAATTKSLSTNFTLVNLGTDAATVTVDYWLTNGTAWPNVSADSKSFTLAANGGQKQIRQYADTMNPGAGSAVVSSSAPLGAIVQIQARNQVATTGAYKGASSGSSTFYIPLVSRRGSSLSGAVNSQIIVQNAGSGPANFAIDLIPTAPSTDTYTKTVTSVAQGASYYYDVETEANLDPNWFGSAVVRSTNGVPLVVVTNVFFGTHGLQTFNAFPVESLDDEWVIPLFTSKLTNGLSTVVTVQNLNGGSLAANSVTLACKTEGSATVSLTKTNPSAIANNAAYSFNPVGTAGYPDNYWGACVVTGPANAKLATYVQMRYVNAGQNVSTGAYEAIAGNTNTTSFYVPLVAKRLSNGFATVVNIANLASSANTVNLTYTPSPLECPVAICDKSGNGTVGTEDAIAVNGISIPANGGNQRNHRNSEPALPNGWVGSLRVTSASSLPIGGIVQLTYYTVLPGDTQMAHGSFGQ